MSSSDEQRARLVDLTRELIDIPSVSYHEAEITEHIRSVSSPLLHVEHDDNGVLVLATPRRQGATLVVLAGHTDTVPIEENLPSTEDGGVIFGRGASDMKGGLAVMLEIGRWCAEDPTSEIDVCLAFFPCEEVGSDANLLMPAIGACRALRGASFAILMEPTSNAVEAGCMGSVSFELKFVGEAAHSARPWKGRNAAHDAIKGLQEVANLGPTDVDVDGLIFREVASVTGMHGGVARNVIPSEMTVEVNVRYAPTSTPDLAVQAWHDRLAATGARVRATSHASSAPVVVNHPLVERLLSAGAGAAVPKQASTNAADFAHHGIPAINFGPGDPQYAHRRDEQISASALLASFQVLQRFFAGTGSRP